MCYSRKVLFLTLVTILGLAPALDSANAACASLAGNWKFFSLEITPRSDSYAGDAIDCTLAIAAGGNVKGTCVAWGQGGKQTATMTGKLTLTSCVLGGTLNPGKLLTIRGGYVSGDIGMGIATQHTSFGTDAMHFTLAKKH